MATSYLAGGTAYPGGKGKTFHHIINLMPPHFRYIETHLGSGAVMRHKRLARTNIGIEIDERVVSRWRANPMPGVDVVMGDAVAVLAALQPHPGDLIYCDPPYITETRRRPGCYRYEYTDADHLRLIEILNELQCHVVISGYRSDLYDHRLSDWHRTDYAAPTHRGVVPESAWTNFQPGPLLHDYSYIGGNFRERERLRRRIGSLTSRLVGADPLERNAVLAALADSEPEAVAAAMGRMP